MKRLTSSLFLVCASLTWAGDASDQVEAVKQTVVKAYVEGIHINGDIPAIRKGFHPDFTMYINRDGKLSTVTIDQWIARIEAGKEKRANQPKPDITHRFSLVDVVGKAAVIRIEMYRDGNHIFTDYMSLYQFEDGWKIVAKLFQTHP